MRRRRTLLGALLVVTAIAALVVFGGGFFLERWANARKDQVVTELQAQLGRPVKAGRVEVSWVPGFALDTGGIEIGPASTAEPGPALRIERARLRVGLWRAVFSLGRRLQVKEASLVGVTANVVRFPDGTLNWQQIRDRLDSKKSSEPMSPSMRDRLRGLVVEHAGIDDARVRFVDLARGGATAEVSDLDLSVDGAGFSEPFTARLTAAVQSKEKNLEMDAGFGAAPRGDQLSPPLLRRVAIRLRPVDIAPLAPFLASGALAELDEGRLAVDLKVDLGAAAPGGLGPTTAKGSAQLTGARIARGERFDGSLDSDLSADTAAGNVDVRKLRVALGAMAISAAGKLLDLRGAPRFDKFTVTSSGLDFDTLRRYYPPLEKASGMVMSGPFVVSVNADADSGAQRFAARIDLTGASLAVPGKLDKPAGTRLSLEAEGRAEGRTVRCERMLLAMGDARVEGQGVVHPTGKGGRPFEATFQAQPFALRPLLALLDPRGSQGLPDLRVGAKVKARGQLGHPESMRVEVPSFSAASGASQVSGSLTVENLDRPRITLDGRAGFLDLDDFLPAKSPARASGASAGKAPPSLLTRAQGRAKLDVARGRAGGFDYQNLRADLTLAEGRLKAHTLEVGAFGGKFSGAGSELPLAGEQQPFVAKGTVAAMDVSALLARFAPGSRVMRGALSADIDLAGRGVRPGDLARSLTGKLSGGVANAEFLPAALLDPVVKALSHAVKVPALSSVLAQADQRVAALRDHTLGDLAGVVRFADGVLELAKPLEAKTSYGVLSLGGKVRLDGRADLAGTVAVAPEVVSAIIGGRLDVTEPLPIKLRITGPIRAPRISPTELEAPARVLATAFAKSAVAQAAKEQVQKVTEPAKENVQRGVDKAKEAAGRRLRRMLPR